MAVLRLFAQAREAAGTSAVELEGSSVGDVVQAATTRFGADFEQVVAGSKLWLNGEPTEHDVAVGTHDEVAVLPPISGGCG